MTLNMYCNFKGPINTINIKSSEEDNDEEGDDMEMEDSEESIEWRAQ